MPAHAESRFDALAELVYQVKPGLPAGSVRPGDRVVDDLGLDSLDLLQLARKIVRRFRVDFDLDAWDEGMAQHRGTLQSILDTLE